MVYTEKYLTIQILDSHTIDFSPVLVTCIFMATGHTLYSYGLKLSLVHF